MGGTADSYEVGSAPWEQGSGSSHPDSFPVGSAPWETPQEPQSKQPTSKLQSFTDSIGNAAALGYMPQAVGAVTKFLSPSKDDISSIVRPDIAAQPDKTKIPYNPYLIGRDTTSQELGQEQSDNKWSSRAGSLAGAIGSAIMLPLPKALMAAGTTGKLTMVGIAKAAAGAAIKGGIVGAGYGAASNPGDVEGQIDPLQLDARGQNAVRGAKVGALIGGVTQGVTGGIKKALLGGETVPQAAASQGVTASGAMLKDWRALEGADQTQATGQFALDKGLVQAGDTFSDVGRKAEALKADAGQRLESVYNQAKDVMNAPESIPEDVGFNPVRDRAKIVAAAKSQLGDAVGAKSAVSQVEGYLDELTEKYGDNVLDPKTANNIEGALSKKVNWSRNPMAPDPAGEQAFRAARSVVSDHVDNHIDFLESRMKDPGAGAALRAANKDYGFASKISDMANDKANRLLANQRASLGDRVAAGGGMAAGAAVGALSGEDHTIEGIGGALLGGLALGGLNKLARTRGASTMAAGLNSAAQNPGPSTFMNNIPRVAAQLATQNGAQSMLNSQPPPQAMQPQQQAPQQVSPAPSQPFVPPQQPPAKTAVTTGPTKWANDGFQNLKGHVSDDDKQWLEDNRSKLMVDPKSQNLLFAAQGYKPGSKPLDDIMKHLKNRLK